MERIRVANSLVSTSDYRYGRCILRAGLGSDYRNIIMNCHPCTGRIDPGVSRNQIHSEPKLHGATQSRRGSRFNAQHVYLAR